MSREAVKSVHEMAKSVQRARRTQVTFKCCRVEGIWLRKDVAKDEQFPSQLSYFQEVSLSSVPFYLFITLFAFKEIFAVFSPL